MWREDVHLSIFDMHLHASINMPGCSTDEEDLSACSLPLHFFRAVSWKHNMCPLNGSLTILEGCMTAP